jgi:hypothetical protein
VAGGGRGVRGKDFIDESCRVHQIRTEFSNIEEKLSAAGGKP